MVLALLVPGPVLQPKKPQHFLQLGMALAFSLPPREFLRATWAVTKQVSICALWEVCNRLVVTQLRVLGRTVSILLLARALEKSKLLNRKTQAELRKPWGLTQQVTSNGLVAIQLSLIPIQAPAV